MTETFKLIRYAIGFVLPVGGCIIVSTFVLTNAMVGEMPASLELGSWLRLSWRSWSAWCW